MKQRFVIASFFIPIFFLGCASMQLKKGQEAFDRNNCLVAYEYFKKAPEDPRKNESLVRGLQKSLTCLARQRVENAESLYKDSLKRLGDEHVEVALTNIKRALQEITRAIDYYKEAAIYSKVIYKEVINKKVKELELRCYRYQADEKKISDIIWRKKGIEALKRDDFQNARSFFDSISSKDLRDDSLKQWKESKFHYFNIIWRKKGIEALKRDDFQNARSFFDSISSKDLRDDSLKQWKESKFHYLKCNAKLASQERRFSDAIVMYEQALSLLSNEENILRRETESDLINVLCQTVRHNINESDWLNAQEALNKLGLLVKSDLYSEQIKEVNNEFRLVHASFLVKKGQNLIHCGDFNDARLILILAEKEGDYRARQILDRLDFLKKCVEQSVNHASNKYHNLLAQNSTRIDPEASCNIRKLQLKNFTNKSEKKDITNWLSKKGLSFVTFKSPIVHILKPHYELVNKHPDALLSGSYRIDIEDKRRWFIVLDMWLEKNGGAHFFYHKEEFKTDKLKIYSGWPFRIIQDNQVEIVRNILRRISSNLIKRYIPFGRCRKLMIKEMAKKRITALLNNTSLSPDEQHIIEIMIERKLKQ